MPVTLEELKKEVEPWINTLCITESFSIARMMDVIDGDDDFYYAFDTFTGKELHSCVGTFIPLKGLVDEEKYDRMVRIWNLNNTEKAI